MLKSSCLNKQLTRLQVLVNQTGFAISAASIRERGSDNEPPPNGARP